MRPKNLLLLAGATLATLAGCTPEERPKSEVKRIEGSVLVVRDTLVERALEATGAARAHLEADLSTRLMGTVLSVSVQEGDRVKAGQVLLRLDGKDLDARTSGVAAGLDASASQVDLAEAQVRRMRALYADSAVAKASLEQAETELQRAKAGLAMTRSQDAELRSHQGYSRLVAPFSGKVVSRRADPGMMASPGVPLLRMEDASVLRVSVSTTTETAGRLRVGEILEARLDGKRLKARVEGVVPSGAGNLAVVNALIENRRDSLPSGAVATLSLPRGTKALRMVPSAAVFREGDLTGVWIRTAKGDLRRWIRLGEETFADVEVLSGLREGDSVVVPVASNGRN